METWSLGQSVCRGLSTVKLVFFLATISLTEADPEVQTTLRKWDSNNLWFITVTFYTLVFSIKIIDQNEIHFDIKSVLQHSTI